MELIEKTSVASALANLVKYGIDKLDLNYIDGIYAHNQLIDLFKIDEPSVLPESFSGDLYADILSVLLEYALQSKMIEKYEVENFKAKVMGYVMPSPSAVIDKFDWMTASKGVRNATTWLYNLSTNSAYINLPAINKNLNWKYPAKDGDLIITINTSRPEKDPKEIALAAKSTKTNYPKCMLCVENIGYAGRINHPARQNLRFIPIPLKDDSIWYMQFSPYRYFNEHCIFFNEKHEPMAMGEKGFARMVELVKNVPHYFIGSNAPLPIVGGSILAHDHYQGGAKEMPEFKAKPKVQYFHPKFPGVKFSIVNWYNSVIRIKSDKEDQFIKAMTYVNDCWAQYSDPQNDILASSSAQHNAITPVVHMERGEYYAEMFLRNNRTDEKHPYGIFHPSEELHHIKKEGIGVIEVMGTFILPGRLASYIHQIRRFVARVEKYDEEAISKPEHPLYGFRKIIMLLMSNYDKNSIAKADKCLLMYISQKCEEVLRATAVFKSTSEGFYGFQGFMRFMGMENSEFRDNNSRQFYAQKRVERDSSLGIENAPFMKNSDGKTNTTADTKDKIALLAGEEDLLVKNVDDEPAKDEVKDSQDEIVEPVQKNRGRKPKSAVSQENDVKTEIQNSESVDSAEESAKSASVAENNTPKKRGRKSNAERERLRQLEEMKNSDSNNKVEEMKENVEADGNKTDNDENVSANKDGNAPSPVQASSDEVPVKPKRGRPKKVSN